MNWKALAFAVAVITTLAFSSINTSADTYVSGRETVNVDYIIFDAGYTRTVYLSTEERNITLFGGVDITQIDTMTFSVNNNGSSGVDVVLTVNGIELINQTINASDTVTKSKTDYVSAGGDTSLTYIHYVLNAGTDVVFSITLSIDDGNATSLSDVITVKEKLKTIPHIEFENSYFSVEDRIALKNPSNLTLTTATMYLTYPSHASSKDDENIIISEELSQNETIISYVTYQKKGPYIYSVGEAEKNQYGDYELSLRIKSYENETNATWTINYNSEWATLLPNFNKNTLKIEIEDEEYEFTSDATKITINGINLKDGINVAKLTWTPQTITPPAEIPSVDTTLIITVIVIIVLIALVFLIIRK